MSHAINGSYKRNPGKLSLNTVISLFTTAALIMVMASCNSKPATSAVIAYPNDLVSDNIKGPVTEIETDSYVLDSTGKPGAIDEKYLVKYDSSGFVASVTTTNGKDSVKTIATFTHNARGLFTEQKLTDGNNKNQSSLIIEYDSTNNPIIAKSYDSTGKMDMYYTDIIFNKYGKVLSATGYHPDSTLKMSFVNDYDSIHYIGGSSKDSTGKITYSSTVQLDSSLNPYKVDASTVTKDSATKKDVTKKSTTINTYGAMDSHGNWTEQTEQITGDDTSKKPHLYKRVITYKQ